MSKGKRTPEQVHAEGGHDEKQVRSCTLCHPADAETTTVGETGPELVDLPAGGRVVLGTVEEFTEEPDPTAAPLPPADPAGYAEDSVPLRVERADDGRPKCNVTVCVLPEFVPGIGVCGGHFATHRGYANKRSG